MGLLGGFNSLEIRGAEEAGFFVFKWIINASLPTFKGQIIGRSACWHGGLK
jgi:hypothetical protein